MSTKDKESEKTTSASSDPRFRVEAAGYPCKKCDCPNFESGIWNSVTCKCGHDTKDHGLPF